MLATVSSAGSILVLAAIFCPEETNIMQNVPLNACFLALSGLCTSVMWGAIFNLSVHGLGKSVASASGIFMTMVCGGGIFPFLQNVLSDKIGYLPSYWMIICCLIYLLYYALAGSKHK